jgi:hypothetical protein
MLQKAKHLLVSYGALLAHSAKLVAMLTCCCRRNWFIGALSMVAQQTPCTLLVTHFDSYQLVDTKCWNRYGWRAGPRCALTDVLLVLLVLQETVKSTLAEQATAKTATLTYNATICLAMLRALGAENGMTELGNGICNGGPFNTAVCGYDRVSGRTQYG